MRLKTKKTVMLTATLLLLIYLLFFNNSLFRVLPIMLFIWVFYLIDLKFKFGFKFSHYLIIIIINILGILMSPLYYQIDYYDKILHFTMPFIASMIIFHIINKFNVPFKWKLLFTLSIMLSISLLLEISEYLFDLLLNMKLQGVFIYDKYSASYTLMQNGLEDTMIDVIWAFFGGITYIISKLIQNKRKN